MRRRFNINIKLTVTNLLKHWNFSNSGSLFFNLRVSSLAKFFEQFVLYSFPAVFFCEWLSRRGGRGAYLKTWSSIFDHREYLNVTHRPQCGKNADEKSLLQSRMSVYPCKLQLLCLTSCCCCCCRLCLTCGVVVDVADDGALRGLVLQLHQWPGVGLGPGTRPGRPGETAERVARRVGHTHHGESTHELFCESDKILCSWDKVLKDLVRSCARSDLLGQDLERSSKILPISVLCNNLFTKIDIKILCR